MNQRLFTAHDELRLGAQQASILRSFVVEGLQLVLLGMLFGGIAAALLTRVMRSLLYGVSATDPRTFAGAAVLLLSVGLIACYLPARRAASIDPITALRYE